MATLTVWKFENWDGANQAIGTLESLAKQKLIKIHDAATVSWQPEKRRPRTRQVRNMTGPGAVGGAFWGMLFGTIFLMPFAGAAIGAASGALAGSLVDVGIGAEGGPAAWAPVPGRLVDALGEVGIAVGDVDTVVLTHLHEDHCGGVVDRCNAERIP